MQIKLYKAHEANILKNYYEPFLKGKIFGKNSYQIHNVDYITDKFQGSQVCGFYKVDNIEKTIDITRLVFEFNLKSPEEVLSEMV